ncbi:tetratricopeptide repeat protein [Streptomyces bambusae]|uniref:FxSxx-COOH system tetratricopeptide repeat protein n=1 Tax=Streptomyces bambusae TaxID=1550616 RepID=UPI001CFD3E5C|nr:FxSxx-COOH system tetratricopeptide repeat protein [Streptomyces bambusae]MCB5165069.1 tetratricopeptide repeat protein [Streptomyces bambusae]
MAAGDGLGLGVSGDRNDVHVDGDVVAGDKHHNHYYPTARTPVAWPLRIGSVPLLATAFQPRPHLRAAIDEARHAGGSPVLTQVLSGGGGVGKSQLAAAYAHEAGLLGTDLVLWVPATEVQQIVILYAEAARLVGAAGADGSDVETDARAFLNWTASTARSWLVVLDDITDPVAVGPWWPAGPAGWVLATSRLGDARMTGGNRTRIDIGLYTPEEAVAYLKARLAGEAAAHLLEDRAADLAEALGRLPLALGHAAAYLVNEGLTAGAYLARLEDSRQRLDQLLPGWADTEQYGRSVAATLLLSLTAANAATPGPPDLPERILQIVALLDPAGHPAEIWETAALRGVLRAPQEPEPTARPTWWKRLRRRPQPPPPAPPEPNPSEIQSALQVLHRYHLITYDSRSDHRQIRIHALTARAVRETTLPARTARIARATADALVDVWPWVDEHHRELAATLRTNTDALRLHADGHLWSDGPHSILYLAGHNLTVSGLYGAAHDHWQAMLDQISELFGANHPEALKLSALLAAAHSNLGHYREALALEKTVLADFERRLGIDHPDTLVARANLATTYHDLGRYEEALGLEESVLADRERILGGTHIETLRARANLAATYSLLDRYEEARTLEESVLADRERILGTDHPDTLITRANLATTYHDLDRHDEALALEESVLADRERILGTDHPDTLLARANLANAYGLLDRHDEALALKESVLADRERTLGTDHPDTLLARRFLATTYARLHRREEALVLMDRAKADYLRVLGPEHPGTITCIERAKALRQRAEDD